MASRLDTNTESEHTPNVHPRDESEVGVLFNGEEMRERIDRLMGRGRTRLSFFKSIIMIFALCAVSALLGGLESKLGGCPSSPSNGLLPLPVLQNLSSVVDETTFSL